MSAAAEFVKSVNDLAEAAKKAEESAKFWEEEYEKEVEEHKVTEAAAQKYWSQAEGLKKGRRDCLGPLEADFLFHHQAEVKFKRRRTGGLKVAIRVSGREVACVTCDEGEELDVEDEETGKKIRGRFLIREAVELARKKLG